MKTCPFCAEMIQDQAVKCRFCGEKLYGAEKVVLQVRPAIRSYYRELFFGVLFLPLFGVGLIFFIIIAFKRAGRRYILTSRRVMVQRGFISKDIDEVAISHIRSVKTKIGVAGRILGFGSISIGTAGTAGFEIVITGIMKPKRFKEMLARLRKG